jgi:1-acyl-sn-glycerol-3-phosphate acyltransferase
LSQPGRSVIAAFVRSLTGVTVRWMGGLPDTRQTIYFANHTSHLDFVVLWSVLPPEVRTLTRPVAAKDYWQSGLRRRIAVGVFNAVLVERGGGPEGGRLQAVKHSLDVLLEALSAKNSLIIFPEGTRGTGETVARFKSGIYRLWCKRPDVLFVPVYLANLNRILPKGEVLPVPVISRAVFGQPLALQAHETKESFLEKAHAAVCALRQA